MSEDILCPSEHLRLWEAFSDRDYRHAYAEGHCTDFLAAQIHSLRTDRGWNQTVLANHAGVAQPQISNWESTCEGVNLTSLFKLAEAFDVALLAKFVPFSALARETFQERSSKSLPSFGEDSPEAIRRSAAFRLVEVTQVPARRKKRNGNGQNPRAYVQTKPIQSQTSYVTGWIVAQ